MKNTTILFAASLLAVGCASAPKTAAPRTMREFRLVDRAGSPIEGAKLRADAGWTESEAGICWGIDPAEAITDADGRAELALPVGMGDPPSPMARLLIEVDHPDYVMARNIWSVSEGIVKATRGRHLRLELAPPAGAMIASAKPLAEFVDLNYADGALTTRRFSSRASWTIIEATTTAGEKLYSGMVRIPAPPEEGATQTVALAPARRVDLKIDGVPTPLPPAYARYVVSIRDTNGNPVKVLTEEEFKGCSQEFGCGVIQAPHYFGSADIAPDGTFSIEVPVSAELVELYPFIEGYALGPQDGQAGHAMLISAVGEGTRTVAMAPRTEARVRAVDEAGNDLPDAVLRTYPGLFYRVGVSTGVPCTGVKWDKVSPVKWDCMNEVTGSGILKGLFPGKAAVTAELKGWQTLDPKTLEPTFAAQFDVPPPGGEQLIVMRRVPAVGE